jgi:uncharacterized protein (DUF305 family)
MNILQSVFIKENIKNITESDKNFLLSMIKHHEDALQMASQIVPESVLYSFAQNIIKVQTKEIDQMKKWIKQ